MPSWSLWRELRAEGRECGQDLLAKAQRKKAEEKEMGLQIAREDDLKLVLMLQGPGVLSRRPGWSFAGWPELLGYQYTAPREPALVPRLQVVWAQPGGLVGIGGGPLVLVGCHTPLSSFQKNGRCLLSRCDVPGTMEELDVHELFHLHITVAL